MKKILSLLLVAVMMVSVLPVAYAADTQDYTQGTAVVYTASNSTDYEIAVPASLDPGASGTVTLSGSWASNQTVKVTADTSVTLTNSINANDQKTLAVTFAGMEKAGDNSEAKTYTESVSVAAMPSDALFGTWDGKFNYYVELVEDTTSGDSGTGDDEGITLITFTIDGTEYQVEEGTTWGEWAEATSGFNKYTVETYEAVSGKILNYVTDLDSTIVLSTDVISAGEYVHTIASTVKYPDTGDDDEQVTTISFTIDGTECQAEDGMTWAEWIESEYNTLGVINDAGGVEYQSLRVVTTDTGKVQYASAVITATTYKTAP